MFKSFLSVIVSVLIVLMISNLAIADNDFKKFTKQLYIKNFDKVDDTYYRGARPNPQHYLILKNKNIKTEIDLRLNDTEENLKMSAIAAGFNIKYYNIPLNPLIPPTQKQIDDFFSIISNKDNLPVYVHCTHGQDRTGLMTALYRVEKYNWNFNQCYQEMIHYGFHPRLYVKLKNFLKEYINKKADSSNNNAQKQE